MSDDEFKTLLRSCIDDRFGTVRGDITDLKQYMVKMTDAVVEIKVEIARLKTRGTTMFLVLGSIPLILTLFQNLLKISLN